MNRARYKLLRLSAAGEAKLEREDGFVLVLPAEWLPDEAREGFTLIGTLKPSANDIVIHLAIEAETVRERPERIEHEVEGETAQPASVPATG